VSSAVSASATTPSVTPRSTGCPAPRLPAITSAAVLRARRRQPPGARAPPQGGRLSPGRERGKALASRELPPCLVPEKIAARPPPAARAAQGAGAAGSAEGQGGARSRVLKYF